jgi:putative transposase
MAAGASCDTGICPTARSDWHRACGGAKSLDTLIPILYLKGVSTGGFAPALAALVGKDAPGLSATTIARLKEVWTDEHKRWSERDLSAKSYVYVWADGVYLQERLEDEAQCILVIIGAPPEGKKELIGFVDGARESAHDWRAPLLDLKRRGLSMAPKVAVADGALGFWKAIGELWPKTREQRCWVHKTANILNKLPKSQQPKAKRILQDIPVRTQAAVAARHVWKASSRKARSMRRDVRWRWKLKVFWTAA